MRLSRIISLILAVFLTTSCTFAVTVVKGRILGGDGKAMQAAHVSLLHPNNTKIIKIVRAGKSGQFSMRIDTPGLWMLHAAGVGYRDQWIALYIEKEKSVQIEVRLGGYRYLSTFDRAAIVGDFNSWHILTAVPLKASPGGMPSAEVTSLADTVAYRIINVRDGDAVEGMQADRYVYDPVKGYISVLSVKKGEKIKIALDLKRLARMEAPSKLIFVQSGEVISRFAMIMDSLQQNQDQALAALIDYRRSFGNNTEFSFNWASHIEHVENQIKDEKAGIVRQALFMSYLTMSMAAKHIDAAVYKKALDEIPPTSIVWELKPHNLFYAVCHSGMSDAQQEKYMQQVIDRNSSQSVKIAALFDMYMASKLSDQKEKASMYYNLLVKRFGSTEEGKTIITQYPLH